MHPYKKDNIMKKVAIAILFGSMAFTACKKDKTAKEKITAHTWRITSQKVDGVETQEGCDLDDKITFTDNGSVSVDAGSIKCDPTDPQITTGTYTISESSLVLIDPAGLTISYNITKFDEDRLEGTASLLGVTAFAVFER